MARPFQPLRGVRVLAFESAFSLPAGTRTLAEMGADVVRVGRPARNARSSGYITVVDGGALLKQSLALDLATDAGRALARELAAKADIICNNFRPRVMRRYGLDYDSVRALKPDIIFLQMSGYGTLGPWGEFPAYGPSTEAAGGMNQLIGEAADPPMRIGSGVFADQAGGRYAALALIAALAHRQRTGEGQYMDLSMAESITHLLGDRILNAAIQGMIPPRHGNRDPRIAPQGIYPALGNRDDDAANAQSDEWIALSVLDDEQWRTLVGLIGDEALADPRFCTHVGRQAAHDEIDRHIAAWTRSQEKDALAALLQQHGIPAGPVQTTRDLHLDPHLRIRGAFRTVQHARPVLGYTAHPHLTTPWQVAGHERAPLTDLHPDGADNRRVLRRWLKLPAAEVTRLEQCGALLPPAELQVPPPIRMPGQPVDAAHATRLGLPAAEDA